MGFVYYVLAEGSLMILTVYIERAALIGNIRCAAVVSAEQSHEKVIYRLIVGGDLSAYELHEIIVLKLIQYDVLLQQKIIFTVSVGKRQTVMAVEVLIIRQKASQLALSDILLPGAKTSYKSLLHKLQLFKVISRDALICFKPHFLTVYIEELMKISIVILIVGK